MWFPKNKCKIKGFYWGFTEVRMWRWKKTFSRLLKIIFTSWFFFCIRKILGVKKFYSTLFFKKEILFFIFKKDYFSYTVRVVPLKRLAAHARNVGRQIRWRCKPRKFSGQLWRGCATCFLTSFFSFFMIFNNFSIFFEKISAK